MNMNTESTEPTLHQDHSRSALPPQTMFELTPSLLCGQRLKPLKGSRGRKSIQSYVAEFSEDLSLETLNKDGKFLQVLVCKYCTVVINARTDRIKEHLNSRRHQRVKSNPVSILVSQAQPFLSASLFEKGKKVIISQDLLREGKRNGDFENNRAIPDTDQKLHSLPTQMIPNAIASIPLQNRNQSGFMHNSEPVELDRLDPNECLKIHWNGFDSNMRNMFKKYLDTGEFADVMLWVEGKPIKCHRLILSAASPYFGRLLRGIENEYHCSPHGAIIPLPGFRFSDVKTILEFIYNGEFELPKKDIESILEVAASLEIQSLVELEQYKIPRVQRNYQADVGNKVDQDIKTKVGNVEPNNPPEIELVRLPNIPMSINPLPGFNLFDNMNSTGSTGPTCVNGNRPTTSAYNYNRLHPAGMTNPVELSRGMVELMNGYWGS